MDIKGRSIIENNIIKYIEKTGNKHVFYFWNDLNDAEKNHLIGDLTSIDFGKMKKFYKSFKKNKAVNFKIEGTEYFAIDELNDRNKIKISGENALCSGEIGFLTVAGGQGSRLDYDHPKGCFPISPVKNKPLFQIFAEKIKFYSNHYKNEFHWFIMTSCENNDETEAFFRSNNYFGLNKEKISFFTQGMLPSLSMDGKLILQDKKSLFKNPDGHGGVIKALSRCGLLKSMKKNGIKHLVYFQVDNPLVDMCDPYFIGYHLNQRSQVSSKVIEKSFPEEKLGVICKLNNKKGIVEYSDLPNDKMHQLDENGRLKYRMGSIAIHIFNVAFLVHCSKNMKVHHAIKKVMAYDFNGEPMINDIDALKFESFVFDSIPMAKKSVFYETGREEEFSPLKNKTGKDSIETCKNGQNNQFKSWLADSGIITAEKLENKTVEISPLFAPNRELFITKIRNNVEILNTYIYDNKGNINDKIFIE